MGDQKNSGDPAELLKRSKVEVAPETFVVLSVTHDMWLKLLEDPAMSPRLNAPFLIFRDYREVTLVFDEPDARPIAQALAGARVERNYRLLSFDAGLDFEEVGFMARVAAILADAGISILPLASFSRDHVLVKQQDLSKSLKTLQGHVAEVC